MRHKNIHFVTASASTIIIGAVTVNENAIDTTAAKNFCLFKNFLHSSFNCPSNLTI